jgi:hypothetical protein
MRPTFILWIAFGAVTAVWYGIDPAAHPIGNALANAPGSARSPITNAVPRQPDKENPGAQRGAAAGTGAGQNVMMTDQR